MIRINQISNFGILLICSLLLSACSQVPSKRTDSVNLSQQAEKAYQARKWQEASDLYRQIVEQNPRYSHAWFRLGNTAMYQQATQEAIRAYEQAIENYAHDPRYWHNLALARMRQARDTLEQGQELFARDPEKLEELTELDARIESLWLP